MVISFSIFSIIGAVINTPVMLSLFSIIFLASIGKSLGVRRFYVKILLKIFEVSNHVPASLLHTQSGKANRGLRLFNGIQFPLCFNVAAREKQLLVMPLNRWYGKTSSKQQEGKRKASIITQCCKTRWQNTYTQVNGRRKKKETRKK